MEMPKMQSHAIFIHVTNLYIIVEGLALMAMWSRALPQTASCLAPGLSEFESHLGHMRKLRVTWG